MGQQHGAISSVKSMTGYARMAGVFNAVDLEVEIRSVNHRFFEVVVRAPRALGIVERELRGMLQQDHRRGRFEVSINRCVRRSGTDESFTLSPEAQSAVSAYAAACKRYGVGADALSEFIGQVVLRDLNSASDSSDVSDSEVNAILDLARRGSQSLLECRQVEGRALVRDISARIANIASMRGAIAGRSAGASNRLRERFSERLAALAPEIRVDPDRLALEVALLADRVDVSEELSRLAIHLTQFSQLLEQGHSDGIGRKLDFMIQEIGRELNTLGSKAQDAEVQGIVVEAKAELERIREQVQNIE